MLHVYQVTVRGALVLCLVAAAGCAVPMRQIQFGAEPEAPPTLTMTPGTIPGEGSAVVRIRHPGADSIAFESVNGIDRYGVKGDALSVRVNGSFGVVEPSETVRYARRERGVLFDHVKRPIKITTCREGDCRSYYEALTVTLPERNDRAVAVTGGWATVFTRRAITGQDRSVLLRQVLNNSAWSLQAEVATHGFNARLHGYYNTDEHGGAIDLSQTFKSPATNALGYGLAMHVGARKADWLTGEASASLPRRTAYQASIGPSVMVKGLTASSQIGIHADGHETLQVLSTFVSFNGNLTEVRSPVSVTLEKTFAFGGNAIIPRRRDGIERMMMGVQLTPSVALRVGVHTRRSAWPIAGSANDIQVSEAYYSLGAQYTLSW